MNDPVTPLQFALLANAFRTLRAAWFETHLQSRPHEREWERPDANLARELHNAELWKQFSAQTEEIIQGHDRPVTPTCAADLD